MGVIALTNTIGLQLSVSYCIDSYKDLSGEAMVTVILVRNTMSFAIGYGVTPVRMSIGKRVPRTMWLPRGVSPGDRDTLYLYLIVFETSADPFAHYF